MDANNRTDSYDCDVLKKEIEDDVTIDEEKLSIVFKEEDDDSGYVNYVMNFIIRNFYYFSFPGRVEKDHLYKGNNELIVKSAELLTEIKEKHRNEPFLKEYFGYTSFRPLQWEIISALVNFKRDVCAVLAPGYGRALCYQYPAVLHREKPVLVVSPLVDKVKEEMKSLVIINVPTCFLHSFDDYIVEEEKILNGVYSIIYMTPTFISENYANLRIANLKLTAIAIDEAQCLSFWGNSRINCYIQLKVLRKMFPGVPLLALLATPSPFIRDNVISAFKMRNVLTVCSGFDRLNLYFEVGTMVNSSVVDGLKKLFIDAQNWKTLFCEATVIYVTTRRVGIRVARELLDNGVQCWLYCPNTDNEVTHECNLERFMQDDIKVLITTYSHGITIRKVDIKNVIHVEVPKDIESYFKEIGIAGRNGTQARSIILHSREDCRAAEHVNDMYEQLSFNPQVYNRKKQLSEMMINYLKIDSCRRTFLMECFNESKLAQLPPPTCCCDNCRYL